MQETKPKVLKEFEKIAVEAYAEGREPALALRYFAPDSALANVDGWVDLMVRSVGDDRAREEQYVYAMGIADAEA
jgi:hypothetical protein